MNFETVQSIVEDFQRDNNGRCDEIRLNPNDYKDLLQKFNNMMAPGNRLVEGCKVTLFGAKLLDDESVAFGVVVCNNYYDHDVYYYMHGKPLGFFKTGL